MSEGCVRIFRAYTRGRSQSPASPRAEVGQHLWVSLCDLAPVTSEAVICCQLYSERREAWTSERWCALRPGSACSGSPARPLSDQFVDNMAQARDNNNPSGDIRRASTTELQVMATATASRNTVVLNYPGSAGSGKLYRQNSFTGVSRRSSGCFDKENQYPGCPLPPPDLSEETLLAPEHNEVLAKLRFISMLVDTIIGVARSKAAPLAGLTETTRLPTSQENDGPLQRRLQQLLLYMRCLQLLSQTLDYARTELKAKRLKPSTTVKNTLGKTRKHHFVCTYWVLKKAT